MVVRNEASCAWDTCEEAEEDIWNNKDMKEEEEVPFLVAEASASTWTLVLNVKDLSCSSTNEAEEARCSFALEEEAP